MRLRPGSERELTLSVVALSIIFLCSGMYWAWLAPGGYWVNRVFDVPIWNENDPGGWYIAGAHDTLLHPGRTCFGGHPGTPLVILLAAEQALLYWYGLLFGAEPGLTSYVARHMREVWILGKIASAAAQLVSFFLLYQYARALVRRRDLAFLAVALYATSFPATHFQTRVSPEPLMNVFFLATLVALVRIAQPGVRDRARLGWAALAGFAAISAFLCKIVLMGAWPLYAASWIMIAAPDATFDIRRRLRLLAAYVGGAAAAALAYAPFTDWPAFAGTWGARSESSTSALLWERLASATTGLVHGVEQMPLLNLLPELTQSNAFFFFEFLFLLAAAAGVILFLRQRLASRRLLVWSLGYCVVVAAAWFYRGGGQDYSGFHYLFPVMLVLAPMAALSAGELLPRMSDPSLPRERRALFMALVVVIVHNGALFGEFNSKCHDVVSYQKTGGGLVSPVLARLRPGERIAVIGKPSSILHGVSDSYARQGRHSVLLAELNDLLRDASPSADASALEQMKGLGVVYVLDLSADEPRGDPVEGWWSRIRRERRILP